MKKKITYIISDIDSALAFEWTARELSPNYDLLFLLVGKDDPQFARYLTSINVRYHIISDTNHKSFVAKWWKVFSLLKKENPEAVHVHLWRALFLGLSASWILRIKKRIFTRHHAIIHYREYPSGAKWDKICNWLATDIIAISENITKVLIEWEHVDKNKVHLIHHGFDFQYFNDVELNRISRIREKYAVDSTKHPIVGVISRYIELKGIQFIIPAFQKLLKKFPAANIIIANTTGNYSKTIKEMLQSLPANSYTEIIFEKDLAALYRIFDVFVHTPIEEESESFGQTYVEALLAGVPSVFTISGVAAEFIRHEHNALVVDYMNSEAIANAVERILDDKKLRDTLVSAGKTSIQDFSLDRMISKLQSLYG
jgi:glycosyltransferase involved in cell wall biosynthesis